MGATSELRARLAAVEDQLARLQSSYDLAMSSFKFDEANTLQRQIASLEAERGVLVRFLPPRLAARELPKSIVPAIGRPPRRRRARPRR